MTFERITDWNAAYDNVGSIAGADALLAKSQERALRFRDDKPATALEGIAGAPEGVDLFPIEAARGTAVFVHGGYWMRFGKGDWSHLAAGALSQGWRVAVPGYTLCPHVSIAEIARQVAAALTYLAEQFPGPIRLSGHSAGGQIVTRILCGGLLGREVLSRIEHVMTISGVHDLRPLIKTDRNSVLLLDDRMAVEESPALLSPDIAIPVTAWVGADELPEFRRQTELLANVWRGLGLPVAHHAEPGRHHIDVINGLAEAHSPICTRWLADL